MNRLTAEQVAAALYVKPATVSRWAAAGKLRGSKVGMRWLFTQDDVDAFVESRVPVTAPAVTRRRRRRAA